jgi:hypothetical protein
MARRPWQTLPPYLLGQEASGGSRLALLNGVLWRPACLAGVPPDGPAAKIAAVKIADDRRPRRPRPGLEKDENPDGFILESHPYDLVAGPDGLLYVSDAGANTLLKVDPASGDVSLVAVFPGVPGPMPNPNRGGANESDPVPTGVDFKDGNIYVSYLPGFPFLPGSAKVVMAAADGTVSDYATGLSMVTDLRTGPDGQLYAVEMGQFTEQGTVLNSGSIVRVKAAMRLKWC